MTAGGECYCGDLTWTERMYGRVTHKQGCPARTDPWHQGDPQAGGDRLSAEREQEIRHTTLGEWSKHDLIQINAELLAELDAVRADLVQARTKRDEYLGLANRTAADLAQAERERDEAQKNDWENLLQAERDALGETETLAEQLAACREELAQARKERDDAETNRGDIAVELQRVQAALAAARESLRYKQRELDAMTTRAREAEAALAQAREALERIAFRTGPNDWRYAVQKIARDALAAGGGWRPGMTRVMASEASHLAVHELIVAAMAAVGHYDTTREFITTSGGEMPEIPAVERLRRAIGDLEASLGILGGGDPA